jgi:hypothetical protein
MSKSIKRFRKYNDEYYEEGNDHYDHRQHLKEKRLQAALRSKAKASLLDLLENEDY